ncbi:MAG: dihydroxy-acid dehydratase [Parvularculaceae bacterium]
MSQRLNELSAQPAERPRATADDAGFADRGFGDGGAGGEQATPASFDVDLNPIVAQVVQRIETRSARSRTLYLKRMRAARIEGPRRRSVADASLARLVAAASARDKRALVGAAPSVALIGADDDAALGRPSAAAAVDDLRAALADAGAVGLAVGVSASGAGDLLGRDALAMGVGASLVRDVYDAAVYLSADGLSASGFLIAALRFGYLPAAFSPPGPAPSGAAPRERAAARARFAAGEIGPEALRRSEFANRPGPGASSAYDAANALAFAIEAMGLALPGATFAPAGSPRRAAFDRASVARAAAITALGADYAPACEVVDARAFVNAAVALLATGAAADASVHLLAAARAAGIVLDWSDFDALAAATPIVARLYPTGDVDANGFDAADGAAFVFRELLAAGLLHKDVMTIAGPGLARYAEAARLEGERLVWGPTASESADRRAIRAVRDPFAPASPYRVLEGNLGRALIEPVAATRATPARVTAPAVVVHSEAEFLKKFRNGDLNRDFVAVLRFQGPRANGMPRLHKLAAPLAVLQRKGFNVALVTDGRAPIAAMAAPAAICLTPEAAVGGPIGKVRDGDVIHFDAARGALVVDAPAVEFAARPPAIAGEGDIGPAHGAAPGRELFAGVRGSLSPADQGATSLRFEDAAAWSQARARGNDRSTISPHTPR